MKLWRVLVYAATIIGTAALALLAANLLEIDERGSVLCVYGALMLILSFGRAAWLQTFRDLRLFRTVVDDDILRHSLRLIGALLWFAGLLIISFS